jgi:hypothetical protein
VRCSTCHRRLASGTACPVHPREILFDGADEPPVLPIVPGYQALHVLGAGGFAIVFAARRISDGRLVAIKALHDETDERFARESGALRRIGPPTAPELLAEVRATDLRPCFVMELVEGEALSAWMGRRSGTGVATPREASMIIRLIATAIDAVHAVGIIHRDLKPENVVLRADGGATLLDFGLAKGITASDPFAAISPSLTRTQQRFGTATYMSPEQVHESRHVDHQTDLYALGVILFELLTGRPPFVGETAMILQGHTTRRPPPPSELVPELPGPLDDVVARALAKDPAERFASGNDLADAVDEARKLTGVTTTKLAVTPRSGAAARRSVALLSVATGAPADRVLAATDGGVLAVVRSGRFVVAFPSVAVEEGVRAAVVGAQRLAGEATGVIAIHVAELRIRELPGGSSLAGPAIDRPESWLPEETGPVVLTAAAHAVLDPHGSIDETHTIETATAPLRGRAALLEQIDRSTASAFASRTPTLFTLTGGVGSGKTSVVDAIASRIGKIRTLRVQASTEAEEVLALRQTARPIAILVDDGHAAGQAMLDAIEFATRSGEPAAIWAFVAAGPELLAQRTTWGEGAGASERAQLQPLGAEAAAAVIRDLLAPVEVPDAVVARIQELTLGVPLYLVEVAQALKTGGAIRQGWTVVSEELGHLDPANLMESLAERALANLPPSHVRLARLVAILSAPASPDELDAILHRLDSDARTELDASIAAQRLVRAGILRASAGRYACRHPLLARAIEARTPAAERRLLHEAVLGKGVK